MKYFGDHVYYLKNIYFSLYGKMCSVMREGRKAQHKKNEKNIIHSFGVSFYIFMYF